MRVSLHREDVPEYPGLSLGNLSCGVWQSTRCSLIQFRTISAPLSPPEPCWESILLMKQHTNSWHYFIPDFIPFLKALFHNPVYMLFICITVLQFSAFDGMISFMPKYLEQQFGKSASDAIFLIGMFAFWFALFYQLVMSLSKLPIFFHRYVCSCVLTYTFWGQMLLLVRVIPLQSIFKCECICC